VSQNEVKTYGYACESAFNDEPQAEAQVIAIEAKVKALDGNFIWCHVLEPEKTPEDPLYTRPEYQALRGGILMFFPYALGPDVPTWLSIVYSSISATTGASNSIPNTPGYVSPLHNATGVSLTPTLESSAFSDPNAGDTHQASHWVVSTDEWFEQVV
jgi:hypothetical protein